MSLGKLSNESSGRHHAHFMSATLSPTGRWSSQEPLRIGRQLRAGGIVTPVHFDSAHNLLVQIHGRKKLLLFPPQQSRSLYYPCLSLGHVNYSPVDVEAPDYERFPLFKRATPLEVLLAPGEILFIPVRWWHYARALEPTISLNFWWFSADSLRRMWHPYLVYKKGRLLGR